MKNHQHLGATCAVNRKRPTRSESSRKKSGHHQIGRATRSAVGWVVAIAIGVAGATGAVSTPASAGGPTDRRASDDFDVADLLTPPATTDATWEELERAARRDGAVPVIVMVDAPSKRPHDLTAGQLGQQNAAIARVSGRLVRELGGRNLRNLRQTDGLPILAFDADLADLALLRASRRVRSVSLDREFELDIDVAVDTGEPDTNTVLPLDAPVAAVPASAGGTVAATSSNGKSNQLENWWNWYGVGLEQSYAAGYRGAGQTVVVLDTGVDSSHAWLKSSVVEEACFTSINSCPNGSWYQYGNGAARPCTFHTDCAHGTHVAHSAAGTWGVAPDAKIIAIQVFERGNKGELTYRESSLVNGLWYAYQMSGRYRIAAINLSVGTSKAWYGTCDGYTDDGSGAYLTGWIEAVRSRGIATVIAAGNGGFPNAVSHPGCISSAVTVGNTTYYDSGGWRYDAMYSGSNMSAVVDLLAPGTDICSAVPTRFDASGISCSYIGTSMAAPHVAGAFAVLKAKRPSATVDQVLSRLVQSGAPVTDSRNGIVRARINVYSAVRYF